MAFGLNIIRSVLIRVASAIGGAISPTPVPSSGGASGGKNSTTYNPPAGSSEPLIYAQRQFLDGLFKDVENAFSQARNPMTGVAWAPRKRPQTWPILVKTGTMKKAALSAILQAQPSMRGLSINLADPRYGMFHQHGTKRMPARPFFGASKETIDRTLATSVSHFVQLTVQAKSQSPQG